MAIKAAGRLNGGAFLCLYCLTSNVQRESGRRWRMRFGRTQRFFFVEGSILVGLGALAIFVPLFAAITVNIILGSVFLVSGIIGLITTFGARQAPGFRWSLLSGLWAAAMGLILLSAPIVGDVSFTLVLILFFIVEGVATIMYSL